MKPFLLRFPLSNFEGRIQLLPKHTHIQKKKKTFRKEERELKRKEKKKPKWVGSFTRATKSVASTLAISKISKCVFVFNVSAIWINFSFGIP